MLRSKLTPVSYVKDGMGWDEGEANVRVGGHSNDLKTFVLFYVLPNSFWIVFPGWCTYWFAKEIVKGIESGGEGKVKKRV